MLNQGIIISRTLISVILCTIAIFLSIEELIPMIFILSPFSIIFKFFGMFTVMPVLFIILSVKCILRNHKLAQIPYALFVLLFLVNILNALISYNDIFNSLSTFVSLFSLISFILITDIDRNKVFMLTSNLYIVSVIMLCVFSELFINVAPHVIEVAEHNLRNIGFSNEWDFGRSIIVAIAFVVYWLLKNRKYIILGVLVIMYFLSKLISTGLYSGALSLVVMTLCLPFCFGKSFRQQPFYFLVIGFLSILLIIALYYLVYIPMVDLRGGIGDNGRFELWNFYINLFINDWKVFLIGVGGGCISNYAHSISMLTTHNVIIETMVEYGLIGIVLLSLIIKRLYSGQFSIYNNKKMIVLFSFLGTCLTQGVSGNEMIFLLMMICYDNSIKTQKQMLSMH